MEIPPTLLDQILTVRASAAKHARELASASAKASSVEAFWTDLEKYLRGGRPLHLLDLIEKQAQLAKELGSTSAAAMKLIDEASHTAKQQSETVLRRYPSLLNEACLASGLSLDSTSRHPRYSLEKGFLIVEILEGRGTARLSDHEGRLEDLPADIPAVVDALAREHRRLFDRPFDGRRLLRTIRGQYKAVIKKSGGADGDSVPIRHITRRLGKNSKGFRTDEFLVDLSRLSGDGPFEIDGRRLDLQHTKDTSQGMLLIGDGYIGFVIFREAHP